MEPRDALSDDLDLAAVCRVQLAAGAALVPRQCLRSLFVPPEAPRDAEASTSIVSIWPVVIGKELRRVDGIGKTQADLRIDPIHY